MKIPESGADLLSGKSHKKRDGNSRQRGSEDEPLCERDSNDRHHDEAKRNQNAGNFGVDAHGSKRPGMMSRSAELHALIVALTRKQIQPLGKLEVDRDTRLEISGLVVMPVRLVAPLLHGSRGRLRQDRVAGNQLQ